MYRKDESKDENSTFKKTARSEIRYVLKQNFCLSFFLFVFEHLFLLSLPLPPLPNSPEKRNEWEQETKMKNLQE
jgi:hypothetical protein